MIEFERMHLKCRKEYEAILMAGPERGCEYSFANQYLWGQQKVAFRQGCVLFFAHFYGKSVYPYPIGCGDRRAAIEALICDASKRGIPCRITNMLEKDMQELETLFPGRFHFRPDRDSFDYIYEIDALANLTGRKLQKKRNHYNRFWVEHPHCRVLALNADTLPLAREMAENWYAQRAQEDPDRDYLLEQLAMYKAFHHYEELGMEGIALMDGGDVLAVAMGTRLSQETFDIHFEKAWSSVRGAYAAVNCEFARYLREKFPDIRYLNREDDMGIAGLRVAKLDYHPHHMTEKYWAYLQEEIYGE